MKRMMSIAMTVLLLCSAVFAQGDVAKREAAKQAAQYWLALLDRGNFGQSWQDASPFFQSKISKADWEKALAQVRAPLGAVRNRTLMGSMYQTDVPGAPKGEYVVIQYRTELSSSGTVIETITPMQDNDGTWRVSGYFVKPAR